VCWTDEHLRWLKDTQERLRTVDGKTVEVWTFSRPDDEAVMSAWTKHFRNHYCLDSQIDDFRRGYGCSRAEYLDRIKFPDSTSPPGPSIRAGDFGEILVADYLQFYLEFWVPRTRYGDKTVRNESTKGCDIIGFKLANSMEESPQDVLAFFEAKTQFTSGYNVSRLQNAVDDSAKDQLRKAESLNAIKQRLRYWGDDFGSQRVERFQNPEDRPYAELYGAAVLVATHLYDSSLLCQTRTHGHPHATRLQMLVICGDSFMDLVHELYRRARDEA
jgi:hypothetical protein